MAEDDKVEDNMRANFLKHHHIFKMQSNDNSNILKTAEINRNIAAMESYLSEKCLDELSASYLLGQNLNNYAKNFDNKEPYSQLLSASNNPEFSQFKGSIETNPTDYKHYLLFGTGSKTTVTNNKTLVDNENIGVDTIKKVDTAATPKSHDLLAHFSRNDGVTAKRRLGAIMGKSTKINRTEDQNIISGFKTATEQMEIENSKKMGSSNFSNASISKGLVKRSLGVNGSHTINRKFVLPVPKNEEKLDETKLPDSYEKDPKLKNVDRKLIEMIRNEIMDQSAPVHWDDIAGLNFVKKTIKEVVVLPMLRPDIFTGIRQPPKGILLFGPPGTGKTLIGKCVASQVKSTFFSISASSLTSKWLGECEKLVRALFAVARHHQPAVIFIDEIDSLLCQRSSNEHESSRRLKTEFLVQLDGASTDENDLILLIGATNRPQELDEAARRRFVKRLYIPLPDFEARSQIINRMMQTITNSLSEENIADISGLTDGYSGADMATLCKEASLGPIRALDSSAIETIGIDEVRPVNSDDFKAALNHVRASVSQSDLTQYLEWDIKYGSCGHQA